MNAYKRSGELLESGTRRPISRPKMGKFLNRFIGMNQFLFHESELFYHNIQSPKEYPTSTLGGLSNHGNCPFFGQSPYNFDLQ